MECKKTNDLRKFSHEALEQLRISAVARVEAGESPELQGYTGVLQADAYAGFHHLYDTGRIVEAAC